MQEGILDAFACPICLDYANDAVTTNCCNQVFCKSCIADLRPPAYCPSCRSNSTKVTYKEAVAIQRALDRLPIQCPNDCKAKITRGDLKVHTTSTCTKRTIKCPCPTCTSPPILVSSFATHFAASHGDILVANAVRLFEPVEDPRQKKQKVEQPPVDVIAAMANNNGSRSRLGKTGMRYCGGRLPSHPQCGCCNGYCGPTSGCACVGCMVTELNLRNLPPGWLINNEGAPCRKGETQRYYCGRKKDVPRSDGYCGPTNGPQCNSCRTLDRLADTWYREVDELRKR